MRRTEKLRRLATRLKAEKGRLDALADELREAGFPMCGKDMGRYAVCCLSLALSMDYFAEQGRDKRGARRAPPQTPSREGVE